MTSNNEKHWELAMCKIKPRSRAGIHFASMDNNYNETKKINLPRSSSLTRTVPSMNIKRNGFIINKTNVAMTQLSIENNNLLKINTKADVLKKSPYYKNLTNKLYSTKRINRNTNNCDLKRRKKVLCVKCLRKLIQKAFFNKRRTSVMSRLAPKDSHLVPPNTVDSLSGFDKRKPFSRPFNKTKLEQTPPCRMASPAPSETGALMRQNQELRSRLNDEASNYRRRLDTYKQAQQNQAQLVGRLQAKVLQYKQRCSELEGQMHETPPPITPCSNYSIPRTVSAVGQQPSSISHAPITLPLTNTAPQSLPCSTIGEQQLYRDRDYRDESTDETLRRLEEERQRCEQVLTQNSMLRRQLEESHRVNESLTNDLQKLTNDWEALRDDMLAKEDEWKEEEQAFNDYYNNEHNRLLRMWRDVVSVKRTFKDMQCSMKIELGKMRGEIAGANRELQGACSGVSVNIKHASKMDEAQHMLAERNYIDVKSQIATLKNNYESAKNEIAQREQRNQQLMLELKGMEDRCIQAENQATQGQRLNDEIDRLHNSLRDIAHAVVQDAEASGDHEATQQHLHLSQASMLPPRSPKRSSVRTSQAFAEGTISAVQAALHKYQLLIHDLQVKLQTNNDALLMTKKQLESSEQAKDILTSKVTEVTEKLDSTNFQLSELCKERDSLHKNLDNLRNEKQAVERGRAELNSIVDSLSSDYEKLQNANNKLQKLIDSLDEEKKYTELELQRQAKDKEILEMNLRAEEERTSRFREETITLREEINKLYLNRDLLDQQRMESDSLLNLLEKQRAELELEVEKLNLDKSEIISQLEKTHGTNDTVNYEVKQLKTQLVLVEDERNKLRSQSSDQGTDLAALKKELIAAEQSRLDLDSERLSISEKLKFLEIEKEKVEQELGQVTRERSELSNQLTVITRKKDQLGEELMRLRQRLEQANETNNRLNRNLEDMVKENEEKQVIIEGYEKDLHRFHEGLAGVRSEKEALEAVLFDTNTTLEATDAKKNQMEREVQDLLIKQESLKSQVSRITKDLENSERRAQEMKTQLTNAAANQETEFLQKIATLRALGEDTVKKLTEERENVRMSLEKRMQQALQALENNKDNEIDVLKERYENLQAHLEAVCQQHEEILIRAENDKQQSLLIAHRDKQAVLEKLEAVARDLKAESDNVERLRRENTVRTEKDRIAINQLRDEISRYKAKMEEMRQRSEEELNKMEMCMNTIREERENAQREGEELRVQLRLSEDRADSLNIQLQETSRKLKENENAMECTRKELTDTRRSLADSNIERDKYATTNKELRDHVKQVELQRREQGRSLDDALQKITSLDENRRVLENERTRLMTVLKETENNMNKTVQELTETKGNVEKLTSNTSQKDVYEKELQGRLNNESEERERVQLELHQVKKQLSDLDANLCATRQELGRARCKANQDENRWHNREQELIGRVEEGRCREKRLEDQKHNLEVCLADATQQIQELKARLGGAEGRVRALEEQLGQVETCKKEAENKLSSIGHTLRRIAGVQLDGTVSLPYRLLSPSRRYSPHRGGHDYDTRSCSGDAPIIDVCPEMVRKGVRTLMQQVAQIEREKDDFKTQLCTAKKQIQEAADQQSKSDNKISKLQQMLRSVQEEKTNLESKLTQKLTVLTSVEENLRQKTDELNTLREKANNLELALGTGQEERIQCDERLEKCRQNGCRLESEKRQLQEELARCEGRSSKLDLQRVALEGDIQRLQMALQEKDNNVRTLQERLENQSRSSAQLEDRCVSLKSTVDQLKERLQTSAIAETELRAEINCMQREKTEHGHTHVAGQDKLKQLSKSLTNSENDKRVLAERLEATQHSLNDIRRIQQSQQDMLTRQQEQVAELEVQKSALESQLRIAKWNQENNEQMGIKGLAADEDVSRHQREKTELRGKVDALNEKIRQLESEKKNRPGAQPQSKFSGHVQFDRSEKSLYGGGDSEMDSNRLEMDGSSSGTRGGQGPYSLNTSFGASNLEQENRELRMKVRRLETLLAEKEADLARLKAKLLETPKCIPGDTDRYRTAQIQAERLLDAREQSHRQQVLRLENQISMLREQLAQEAKRRQMYILRSTRAGREMQQLRQTLGDSLRHVAQDPLDQSLLESETKRLDSAVSLSLPPTSGRDYERSLSPRYK